MFSRSQGRISLITPFIFLFICALILPLNPQGIASVKAQDGKLRISHSPKSDIGYEFGDLPPIAQSAMIKAIESRPEGVLAGGTFFVVGHYESAGMWGIGHIGAAVGSEQPDWDNSVWFITNLEDPAQMALKGTSLFNDLFSVLPKPLQDKISPASNNEINAQATIFLFPWDKSQQWRYTYGWHGGNGLALDFAPPYNVVPANMWVLASAGGTVTLVCGGPNYDLYQAAINLTTPDGVMTYRHIDYNSFIGQNVKDTVVNQGRKLALLYNGSQGSGYFDTNTPYPWAACVQGSSPSCTYIKFNTYCGSGTGAHIHWSLPAKPFTVDGWQVGNDAIWRKSGQADKSLYSYFNSTNPPALVNSIVRTNTNPSNAGSVNFTVTFSEAVANVDTNDFNLTTSGIIGASVTAVNGSGATRTVTVNTGSGNGTIRLDIPISATVNDLFGLPPGNFPFTSGETYTINKFSITRVDPFLALQNSVVHFTVTFLDSVTSVDVNDFELTTTGGANPSITGISDSGSTRTITVNTGSGIGTIRLDVLASNTINDIGGNPANVPPFTSGDIYMITTTIYNVFLPLLIR